MALLLVKSTQNTSQRELISSILTHFALTHKNGESLILSSLKHLILFSSVGNINERILRIQIKRLVAKKNKNRSYT